MTALPAVLNSFADQLAPFVRQDDLYGNILLPSVIGNQKGCLRAIINRRPFFLYRGWALSTPESLAYLKRKEREILKPLARAVLDEGIDRLESCVSSLSGSSVTLSSTVEAIFRYLVVSMQDEEALRLAVMYGDRAGLFLRRSAVLLCIVDPTLREQRVGQMVDQWMTSFDRHVLLDFMALAGEGRPEQLRLPGETAADARLFYSLYESHFDVSVLDEMLDSWAPLEIALERRSVQSRLLYVFEALLSSGRLFAAFRLYLRLQNSGSDHRIVATLKEECLRVAMLNERIDLYRRLAKHDEEEDRHRLHYFYMLYGPERARSLVYLLAGENGDGSWEDEVDPAASRLYAAFEEFLLLEACAEELRSFRRYIATFAGDDYRLRALLGRLYQESEPETALYHYDASTHPSLRRFLAMRLAETIGHRPQKRDLRLRKMLEAAVVDRDRVSGDLHER